MHISRIYLSAIHRIEFISMNLLHLQNIFRINKITPKINCISLLVAIWEYTYAQHIMSGSNPK
jgi:hypothetical protein